MRARRSRNRIVSLLLALAVPAIVLAPLAAAGEAPKGKPAKPAANEKDKAEKVEKYDPDNVAAISQYMETIAKATERFGAKDYTAAIDTYKKAIQLSPRNALGHYLLAEAYAGSGNFGEADAAIQQALEFNDGKNPALRAHVLFLRADLFERQKKWEPAKAAWQAYAEFAAKGDDAGVFPQSSAERLKAIQRVLDLEKTYAAVRERIAADKADAGKSAPPSSAPAPKKP